MTEKRFRSEAETETEELQLPVAVARERLRLLDSNFGAEHSIDVGVYWLNFGAIGRRRL